MALKLLIQFGNVHGSSVVENGVQTFEHTLLGEIHLINQEPVPLFDCPEQNPIAPAELNIVAVILGLAG